MKLKDIMKENRIAGIAPMEAIGGLSGLRGKEGSASLLKMAKEIMAKENDSKLLTKEDLVKNVNEFASYGTSIYKKHNLSEVGNTFIEIAKSAQKHVAEETGDWFDRVTVQRNMNDLGKQATQFHKIANEAQGLQDRMSALYEDMGGILNRYFDIRELNEDDDDEDLNAGKKY